MQTFKAILAALAFIAVPVLTIYLNADQINLKTHISAAIAGFTALGAYLTGSPMTKKEAQDEQDSHSPDQR